MSCVTSKTFEKNKSEKGQELIRTYALDDVFHIYYEIFNKYEGIKSADVKLSPYEARIVKDQIEEFLSQQQ